MEDCLRAELARDTLPPGALADPLLARLQPDVERIVAAAAAGAIAVEPFPSSRCSTRITPTIPGTPSEK